MVCIQDMGRILKLRAFRPPWLILTVNEDDFDEIGKINTGSGRSGKR